jgi:hypothetical protein
MSVKAMKIFKTKQLSRFAKQEDISDASLREAISRAERSLIDADLGGGLIKQRVARKGQGRSGGYRMIVAYRMEHRAIFLYGFAKNELDNISSNDLKELREIGKIFLNASPKEITAAIEDNQIQEVPNG